LSDHTIDIDLSDGNLRKFFDTAGTAQNGEAADADAAAEGSEKDESEEDRRLRLRAAALTISISGTRPACHGAFRFFCAQAAG